MKKNLSILLAGVMTCMLFTACGNENTENASDNAAEVSSAAETETDSSAAAADSEVSQITIDFDNLKTEALTDVNTSDFVTPGEYKGITIEAALKEVTDEDVEAYIQDLLSSNPLMNEVTDRAVQDGDTVNIDYVGKYADTQEAFDGGTATGANLVIGSNTYIDGFESGLVGATKGETRDLNLTFPENYGSTDLAGKDVVFTVTVNSIQVASTDMTDEWAASLGYEDVSNIEELKAYVVGKLSEDAKEDYEAIVENTAVQTVVDNATFTDAPQELINRYILQQNQMIEYRASMFSYMYGQQVTPSDLINVYMQNEGFVGTADDYLNSIAKDMANQYLLFQTIADEQGITVSEEDIDEYLKNAYESASNTAFSSYEEYKASLDLEVYREGLMAEKVVKYIVDNANVVEAAAEDAAGEASSVAAE
ncbi:MAG: trigger factor [Butyrivibrio sp.]|nr:trigger factor [Butyrivibrio sp.]